MITTMMNRAYNFGAGPAMLPESILQEAQSELLNYQDLRLSILELGHRTEAFREILFEAETLLRRLLGIPDEYKVLFLGMPARQHFSMVALNFIGQNQTAGYLLSGIWSRLAFEEASRLKNAYSIASVEEGNLQALTHSSGWHFAENTAYLYACPNETINGIRLRALPKYKDKPLIADMTSCLLTEPIEVKDYALIFAGAQKNLANAGLSVVIVRSDLLDTVDGISLPALLNYKNQANHHSLLATPPTFNCYLALKMLKWIEAQGGVLALYKRNCDKAKKLYDFIDASSFYACEVAKENRSLVNVCFKLQEPGFESQFLQQAEESGLLALKGHKLLGGLRASLYNAMPLAGVEALIGFMQDFAASRS